MQFCSFATWRLQCVSRGAAPPFLSIRVGALTNIIPGVSETPLSHSPRVTTEQLSCSHPP